jgi:hypothetical protein
MSLKDNPLWFNRLGDSIRLRRDVDTAGKPVDVFSRLYSLGTICTSSKYAEIGLILGGNGHTRSNGFRENGIVAHNPLMLLDLYQPSISVADRLRECPSGSSLLARPGASYRPGSRYLRGWRGVGGHPNDARWDSRLFVTVYPAPFYLVGTSH